MPPEGWYLFFGRLSTVYYFVHFLLIMPVLGYKEKTIPLPISISEPVLGGETNYVNIKSIKEKTDIL